MQTYYLAYSEFRMRFENIFVVLFSSLNYGSRLGNQETKTVIQTKNGIFREMYVV